MALSRSIYLAIVLVLVLAGCGEDKTEKTATPDVSTPDSIDPTVTVESIPTLDLTVRPTLEFQYGELREAQTAIEEVWSKLQKDEGVPCTTELPPVPVPSRYEGQDELYQAAIQLQTAYNLWAAECANPRTQPPHEIIDEGLRAALSAGDHLRNMEAMLSQ